MRKLYLCMQFALLAYCAGAQQCPAILNCPQGTLLIHDLSNNDTAFWNQAPLTWSPTVLSPNLYEGAADLSLKVLGCSNGGPITISYILYLDLDNDNLNETVVQSTAPPPAGIVLAGNAFNPGFAGGDTLRFDRRPVPDSIIFRFALQVETVGDTTVASVRWLPASSPTSWYVPRMPEGKHRIEWTVEQGGVVRTCEYTFRIKDGLPPTTNCKQGVSVYIDSSGAGLLPYAAVIQAVQDNITPFNQMQFSLRKTGTGTDFPLDIYGNPVPALSYACPETGLRSVELWAKDRTGNAAFCTTTVSIDGDPVACPPNHPDICAVPFWNNSATIQHTSYDISWVGSDQTPHACHLPVQTSGCAKLDSLPPASLFSLIPKNNSKPGNGISTYDLVLISRHILGLQLFDAPWKFIAADINNNGTVTIADIIELRRLILGMYTQFPDNTSWRFFTADCQFPPYPFAVWCPSILTLNTMPLGAYNEQYTFKGVKIGDVNGSADPDSIAVVASDRAPIVLQIQDQTIHAGDILDVQVLNPELTSWSGFQLGIQVDPNLAVLESVEPGALPGLEAGSFGRPAPGLLTASWFDAAPHWILPDERLFTLRIRALAGTTLHQALHIDEGVLQPEVYMAADETRRLELSFNTTTTTQPYAVFPAQPNPTAGAALIPVRLPAQETVVLTLYDPSGKPAFHQEQDLPAGSSVLNIPADAFSIEGCYLYRVQAGSYTGAGKIIRE